MVKLSPEQHAKLQAVANASNAYNSLRNTLRLELEAKMHAELSEYAKRRDIAAYAASLAGVPASQIGRLGIGVTTPTAGREAIARGKELYGVQFGAQTYEPQPTAVAPHELIVAAEPAPEPWTFTLEYIDEDPWEDPNTEAYRIIGQTGMPPFDERRRFEALIHHADLEDPVRMWFYDPHPTHQAYPVGPEIAWSDYENVPESVMTTARQWATKVREDNARIGTTQA